jgi:fucose 4-O-acetylase-like acetyltransferase
MVEHRRAEEGRSQPLRSQSPSQTDVDLATSQAPAARPTPRDSGASTELASPISDQRLRVDLPATGKDWGVETLRGIAVLLVVAGHVIGYDRTQGMEVADDSWLRYSYFSFVDLRMPLFTVISGFVYSLRPVTRQTSLRKFAQGKLRRIGVPLVVVGTLHYLVKSTTQEMELPLWQIYFFAFDHFWFLQAMLVIFAVVMVLDWLAWMSRPWQLVLIFALTMAYALPRPFATTFFSIHLAVRFFPFFVLGCMIQRIAWMQSKKVAMIAGVLLMAAVAVRQGSWFAGQAQTLPLRLPVAATIGACGSIVLFYLRRPNRYLAWLGKYSYTIYLFHVFGTAGMLMVLSRLGVESSVLQFSLSLLAGVLVPIGIEHVIQRVPLASPLLLGTRPRLALQVPL